MCVSEARHLQHGELIYWGQFGVYLALSTLLCSLGTNFGVYFLTQCLLQGHQLTLSVIVLHYHLIAAHSQQHKLSHCSKDAVSSSPLAPDHIQASLRLWQTTGHTKSCAEPTVHAVVVVIS